MTVSEKISDYRRIEEVFIKSHMEIMHDSIMDFDHIVNKMEYLTSANSDKPIHYDAIIENKLEEIEKTAFGFEWINEDCPDVLTIIGKRKLIKYYTVLEKEYPDKRNDIIKDLKAFFHHYQVLTQIKRWKTKRISGSNGKENLSVDKAYVSLFKDKTQPRIVESLFRASGYIDDARNWKREVDYNFLRIAFFLLEKDVFIDGKYSTRARPFAAYFGVRLKKNKTDEGDYLEKMFQKKMAPSPNTSNFEDVRLLLGPVLSQSI